MCVSFYIMIVQLPRRVEDGYHKWTNNNALVFALRLEPFDGI